MNSQAGRDEVARYIFQLLKEFRPIGSAAIDENSTIEHDIQLESVAFVEMQVALEEQFNIELDPIQMIELNQLGQIIDYVYGCVLER